MAEYSALDQTLNPGETLAFTLAPVPCNAGYISHRDGSANFLLSGLGNVPYYSCRRKRPSAIYLVEFGANVSIPEGGTPGPISIAITLDGTVIPESTMTVTPAAAGDVFNVSRAISVAVWYGCCQTLAVTNTSTQAVTVSKALLNFGSPVLRAV